MYTVYFSCHSICDYINTGLVQINQVTIQLFAQPHDNQVIIGAKTRTSTLEGFYADPALFVSDSRINVENVVCSVVVAKKHNVMSNKLWGVLGGVGVVEPLVLGGP